MAAYPVAGSPVRTVLFGGRSVSTYFNDTWVWDGSRWQQADPAVSPSARTGHALATDTTRRRVVLFGGWDTVTHFADTWEWDGAAWSRIQPPFSPSARQGHAMAFDAARNQVVLFGGRNGTTLRNDTWTWDGAAWTPRAPGILAGSDHAMAYDAARSRVVLFGGQFAGSYSNVTWEWDGTAWTVRAPATRPVARIGHALAYDAQRHRIVLFGGARSPGSPLGDTWEYDGNDWTAPSALPSMPATRSEHAMAYDAGLGATLLFGGSTAVDGDDIWKWDGARWTRLSPPGTAWSAMAFDEARGRAVMFGGSTFFATGGVDTTWEWDGSTRRWIALDPANRPTPRSSCGMAFDALRLRVLLFGGFRTGTGYLGDTWHWNGTNWAPLSPAQSPPARFSPAMGCDPARRRVVLFGGQASTGLLADTWEWDGSNWIPQSPSASPSARISAMAYHGPSQRMVLFGGGPTITLDDTWEWNGTTWTRRFPAHVPTGRTAHGMAYDAARNRTVMFGGTFNNVNSWLRNDIWDWDGNDWTERIPAASPVPRDNHVMAYDTVQREIVAFGGRDSLASPGQSLIYSAETWTCAPLHPARATAFGQGCQGSNGIPLLTALTLPWLGDGYSLRGTNLPNPTGTNAGYLVTGFSNTSWLGTPLPLDLAVYGWAGCSSYVSVDNLRFFAGQNGEVTIQRSPLVQPALLGFTFYLQLLVADPAHPRTTSVSNALQLTVGSR